MLRFRYSPLSRTRKELKQHRSALFQSDVIHEVGHVGTKKAAKLATFFLGPDPTDL